MQIGEAVFPRADGRGGERLSDTNKAGRAAAKRQNDA